MSLTSLGYRTITDPTNQPIEGVVVIARLRPVNAAIRVDDFSVISGEVRAVTDASGYYSFPLERNGNITPSNTFWEIEERIPRSKGGTKVWAVVSGATDFNISTAGITTRKVEFEETPLSLEAGDLRYAPYNIDVLVDLPYYRVSDEEGGYATINAAYTAALGSGEEVCILVGPGNHTVSTIILPNTNAIPKIHFEFVGNPKLTPQAANSPIFQGPVAGACDFLQFKGTFTVRPHSLGSTGPAILMQQMRWCEFGTVLYESPGANDFISLFDLPDICYGNHISPAINQQTAPGITLVRCVNEGGVNNPNGNYIDRLDAYFSSVNCLVDAANSTLTRIMSGMWESNTFADAGIIFGSRTYLGHTWIEANTGTVYEVHAAGTDSVNAQRCTLDHNYYSSAQTLTLPASIDDWEILGPLDNLTIVGDGYHLFPERLESVTVWNPPNLADGAASATTVTVGGAALGDYAIASHDGIGTSNPVFLSASVSAPNSVIVSLLNKSGGALDIPSGNLRVTVIKKAV